MKEYQDQNGTIHRHIYLVHEPTGSITATGWYFSDEIEELHGPFETLAETKVIFKAYCDHFLCEGEGD